MSKINLDILILYGNIRQDETINSATKLFNEFDYHEYISYMQADYYRIQESLLEASVDSCIDGTYWQNYICKLISESENRFSLMSEKGKMVDKNIYKIALREIKELKMLYRLDWNRIDEIFGNTETSVYTMKLQDNPACTGYRDKIKNAMESDSDQETMEMLKDYYQERGCGIFEKYQAFIWDEKLVGVSNLDKITFYQLIGYERQKAALIENTEFFLRGYSANNVLLHGDRGTGKSSCVKALLNKFHDSKLRMISLNKNHIDHLYRIIDIIADRGYKYIIYIDDLSFEETETGYKQFKSILEGGIEAQPSNVLIYVTSNRRNIIKETWNDREDGGEVHSREGMQERLSLADRFGLTITFSAPDKENFLRIVKGIAEREGIEMKESCLIEEALMWDVRQKGRSGRSARQFINYIHSKTMLEKENSVNAALSKGDLD
ncbi:MAG: ATP-binding protein [Eubacteriales bacterium]|nr:ATP-binding protein [Eubacteriales bacterium]